MRSSVRSWGAAALIALGAAAAVNGCNTTKGQLMLVFQTDMSLPKDVDAIRILVTQEGAVVYDETFERLGTEDSIRLPATLGFLTPDDPSQAISVRLIAYRGGAEGPRLLREVVTTVPDGRTATLQMPIQFLCDGSAEVARDEQGQVLRDADGRPQIKNACDEGKTCVAGSCVDPAIDSNDLPDYEPAEVFGGGTGKGDGTCFDTVQCFEKSAPAAIDIAQYDAEPEKGCWITGSGDINVALLTQGGGICGSSACYVALDAGSDSGWKGGADGRSKLPDAVCKQAKAGKLLGVVTAPASDGGCRKKAIDLPTCGPWSASGQSQYQPPDLAQPVPIAVGQAHPTSIAAGAHDVFWTTGSTFDASGEARADGAVKTVPLGGGEPLVIADGQRSPRDIVVDTSDASRPIVYWTNAGVGPADGAIVAAISGLTGPITLFSERKQPEGLALLGKDVYWTELWGDALLKAGVLVTTASNTVAPAGEPAPLSPGVPLGASPYRIAAASDIVCWTYQGTLQGGDGAVACQRPGAAAKLVATGQATPRALALDVDASGSARALYWVSFQGGSLFEVALSQGEIGESVEIAAGQALPNGVAVDAESIYWTNRGDGTVMRLPKVGGAPELLAKGQARPGDIVVNEWAVYWINEGSPDLADGTPAKDGAILKLKK